MIDVGGVGYLVVCPTRTLAALPSAGEAVDLHDRHPGARREHHALRLSRPGRARLVPPAADRPGGRRPGRARRALGARARRAGRARSPPRTRRRSPARAASARALPPGSRAELQRPPGRPAAPGRHGCDRPAAAPGAAAADALSALVNLGYGRSEAHAAIAKAAASLGEHAPVDALIRTGLQELTGV